MARKGLPPGIPPHKGKKKRGGKKKLAAGQEKFFGKKGAK